MKATYCLAMRLRAISSDVKVWTFFLLFLVACGTDTAPIQEPDPIDVFRESCASCHGDDGAGTPAGPQILSPVRGFATHVIRHGRGRELGYADEMPAWDTTLISDAQLTSILDVLSAAPKPTTGQGLYGRFCGNCHGGDAQGGRVGKDITRETDEIHEAVREGHHVGQYADDEYMPAWSDAELTRAEVTLIAQYLATLPPGPADDD